MKTRRWKIEDGGWQAQSVLECGGKRSATPLSEGATVSSGFQSARGLAQSKTWRIFGALLTFLAITISVHAQQYSIDWFKISGGGGTSAGSSYQVTGTVGQHDAGEAMTGGNYSLIGGFWSIIAVVQTPGAPLLTINYNSQPQSVTVSWPSSATNFVLQQRFDLTSGNWTTSGYPVSTNGATLSVTISPPTGNLYFRLNSP